VLLGQITRGINFHDDFVSLDHESNHFLHSFEVGENGVHVVEVVLPVFDFIDFFHGIDELSFLHFELVELLLDDFRVFSGDVTLGDILSRLKELYDAGVGKIRLGGAGPVVGEIDAVSNLDLFWRICVDVSVLHAVEYLFVYRYTFNTRYVSSCLSLYQ
jgi:hypothetical protein